MYFKIKSPIIRTYIIDFNSYIIIYFNSLKKARSQS